MGVKDRRSDHRYCGPPAARSRMRLCSLPPERLEYASGLFNMMRSLGGAVGIAVSAAIINDQTNAHFQMIASILTPANGPWCQ